jgi:hypothetical protein
VAATALSERCTLQITAPVTQLQAELRERAAGHFSHAVPPGGVRPLDFCKQVGTHVYSVKPLVTE